MNTQMSLLGSDEEQIKTTKAETLAEKIEESKKILRLACDMSFKYYGKPLIICYSSGKDSDTLLHLAETTLRPEEFEVINSHTSVDYPEAVYHRNAVFKRLNEKGIKATVFYPKDKDGNHITMWNLILTKDRLPTRLARHCCAVLKETSTPNRMAAMGIRAAESNGRKGRDVFAIRAKKKSEAHFYSYDHAEEKVNYIWFDTGLEFQCMKDHLKYLEERYGIEIKRFKAVKPIPWTCRNIGQPFISKRVSEMMARLQKHDFKWEDRPYEDLIKEYPNCQQALKWWCNQWEGGTHSSFNIIRNIYLKEFIIDNPPWFKISSKCCDNAKKAVSHLCYKSGSYDLSAYGVRKLEGGLRATAYQNCFSDSYNGATEYRPLFWYSNNDIAEYEQRFNIKQSALYYEPWNLKRSGCSCCPYGKDFEHELELTAIYEPNLYKSVNNIFGDSYKYTRMYREFQKKMREAEIK